MIRTETFYIGETEMVRTWSDKNVKIHGGFPEADYDDSVDPVSMGRTYVETDIPIDGEEVSAEEVVDILFGGSEE